MTGPTRAELELIAGQIRDFPLFGARAVLVIVESIRALTLAVSKITGTCCMGGGMC